MPFERDPARDNELLLRLPPPLSNIIITPPRRSDVIDRLEGLNDMEVVRWLCGPPYPYTMEDSEERNAKITKLCADAEVAYEKVINGDTSTWPNDAPVQIIREIDPGTGAQKFLGVVDIFRYFFHRDR